MTDQGVSRGVLPAPLGESDPRGVHDELLRAPHRRPVVDWLLARGFVEDNGLMAISWSTRIGKGNTELMFWPWAAKPEDTRWEVVIGHHASGTNPRTAIGSVETLEDVQVVYETIRRINGYLAAEPDREPRQVPSPDFADYKALYHDLLLQVGNKHPGESRHETARRYIRERETAGTGGPASAAKEQP
jgi:hypothetical protein